MASSAATSPRLAGRTGPAPLLLWLIAFGALAAALVLSTGCSRRGEPPITGKSGDASINLSCLWKPGYSYRIRLETEITTDTDLLDLRGPGVHRVSFAQECLIKVTNSPRGDTLNLDLEITSLEMERAKGDAVALSFNSAQGGETIDEHGYIPVLKKMIGGHLRFTVSSGGRVMNTLGLGEWVEQALGIPPGSRVVRTNSVTKRLPAGPAPSVVIEDIPGPPGATQDPPVVVTAPVEIRDATKKIVRIATPVPPGAPAPAGSPMSSPSVANDVSRTVRGFFTPDLFRTLLEFHFVPPAPVRVGEEWKESGDTPITGRISRIKYEATCKFAGWQQQHGTNCARINALGKRVTKSPPAIPPASPGVKGSGKVAPETKTGLDGTVWINKDLGFPVSTLLDKESAFPGDTSTRLVGTNRVTTTGAPKFIRERVTITLLEVTPPAEFELKASN